MNARGAQTCDVAVVGGGIFGCAIAWNLARLGVETVTLLERRDVASQSTSRAAGLLTRVRGKPHQTALTTETRRAIDELGDELGQAVDLRQVGCLQVAASEATERDLETLVETARQEDEPVEWIEAARAQTLLPWLAVDEARRFALMPEEAYVDPYLLATSYARAAVKRGVEVRSGVAVRTLLTDGGRVVGVEVDGGVLHAGTVIVAAGSWSGLLTAPLGHHVPMAPVRSHYWITKPGPLFPPEQPFVVLPDCQAYTRPEVGGLLFGLRDRRCLVRDPRVLPEDLERLVFEEDPKGWSVLEEQGAAFARFFPALFDTELAHHVSGPSNYTPDGEFALGALPGIEGLLLATGCSGGGIATSGGVGLAVAELAVSGTTRFDLAPSRPDRFGAIDAFSPEWLERCAVARSRKVSG